MSETSNAQTSGEASLRNKGHAARSYWQHLAPALPVIFIISGITFGFEHMGWLRNFETTSLDTWLALSSNLQAQHVVIVAITDEDYRSKDLFNNTSPLNRHILRQLLKSIMRGRPLVIGVDLDTTTGDPRERAPRESGNNSPAIVWAREAEVSHDGSVENLLPILGQENPQSEETGVALLPQDWDGVVRRYRRVFRLNKHDRVASFPWAVATRYADESDLCKVGTPTSGAKKGNKRFCRTIGEVGAEDESLEEPIVLNFSGERYRFPRVTAGQALQAANGDGWAQQGPLTGKIVLLGGTYRAARDEYVTPIGLRTGVELMAQAIETELQGGGIRSANHWLMLVLEILVGLALVTLHYYFYSSLEWVMTLSIVAIPVLTCLCSWLAFNTFSLWASFIPIVVSVVIHQLYDHARECQRIHRELLQA